jgi:hypothetical protein
MKSMISRGMILTNRAQWQAHRLTPGLPVQIDLALDIDLLGPDQPARTNSPTSTSRAKP